MMKINGKLTKKMIKGMNIQTFHIFKKKSANTTTITTPANKQQQQQNSYCTVIPCLRRCVAVITPKKSQVVREYF